MKTMTIDLKIEDTGWVIIEYKPLKHVPDTYLNIQKEVIMLKDDLVVTSGLNYYQQRTYSNTIAKMSYGAVGTGTNTPQASDVSLQTELLRKALSVQTNPTTGKLHLEFVIDFQEGNGNTFTEVGIFNASSNGTMLLRKLFTTPCAKTADKKITVVVETLLTATS